MELAKTVGEVVTGEKHQQGLNFQLLVNCQPQQTSREAAGSGKSVQKDGLKYESGKKEQ